MASCCEDKSCEVGKKVSMPTTQYDKSEPSDKGMPITCCLIPLLQRFPVKGRREAFQTLGKTCDSVKPWPLLTSHLSVDRF